MSFSEREVGKAFKVELEQNEYLFEDKINKKKYLTRFKVYLNKRVPTYSQKFKKFWRSKNLAIDDIPPAQPEIDMILVDDRNIWHAIELKAIKKRASKRISPSYYRGLGQSLAYLSFGFDEVAIWQCFDGVTLSDEDIFKYDNALARIRAPIREFVGRTCFKIITNGGKLRIQSEVFPRYNRRTVDYPRPGGKRSGC